MPENDKNIEKEAPLPPPGAQVEIWGEIFSGPIPPPQTLQAFEKAVPGSADRILIMAENEQKHHHKIETLREKCHS